jgi:hypothetical protein
MSNFDLLNRQCDDIILISENYCLDKSFDILLKNFQFFEQKLNSIDNQNDRINIIKERFNKNKQSYYKLLTFVNQFSASLENVHQTFNRYRDTWQTKNTPLEIIYGELIPITNWGNFNQNNGTITRFNNDVNGQNRALGVTRQVTDWVNKNFVEEEYGVYNRIDVRIYIKGNVNDTFTFNGRYVEMCNPAGGNTQVCCNGCGALGGSKGCNRMGPNGRTCGNMYTYCPASVFSTNCVTGTCRGWKANTNKATWQGEELKVTGRIVFADTYLMGYDILNYQLINNRWVLINFP